MPASSSSSVLLRRGRRVARRGNQGVGACAAPAPSSRSRLAPSAASVTYTAGARPILGPGKILAPDQKVLLETDPSEARRIARMHLSGYLSQPNYRNSFIRQGFANDELDDGGSDRLVDAIVAWGSIDTVVARVLAHRDAGADHVAVQVLPRDMGHLPLEEWRAVASALMGMG